jgi:membrane protein YdbS with pleckstrin-like domain
MKLRRLRSAPTEPRWGAVPYDVKAILSAIVLIVAAILSYWSGSPIRHDFSTFVMVVAVLMVAAMWVFPEAGVKKGDAKRVN